MSPHSPVQLYLDKSQWKDTPSLQEDMWITFELKKQPNRERHAAVNAKYLSSTIEDYDICRNYLGLYYIISGIVNRKKVNESIRAAIVEMFFRKAEDRQLVINYYHQKGSLDSEEWELLLSNMTTEERESFALDINTSEPSATLRVYLYKYLNSIEWIKHPNFIAGFTSNSVIRKTLNLLMDCFKSDEDKQEWIDYVINADNVSDKLLVELFIETSNIDFYNNIKDKKIIPTIISNDKEKIKDYFLFCMSFMEKPELDSIVDSFDFDVFIDAMKLMNEDECLQFVCRLSENKALQIISDERLWEFDLSNKLMSSKEGRILILSGIYAKNQMIMMNGITICHN